MLPSYNVDVKHDSIAESGGNLRRHQERPIYTPTRHPGLGEGRARKTSAAIRYNVSTVSFVGEDKQRIVLVCTFKPLYQLNLSYHANKRNCNSSSVVAVSGMRLSPTVIVHPLLHRPAMSQHTIRTNDIAQLQNRLSTKRITAGGKNRDDLIVKSAEPLMRKLEGVGASTYARNVSCKSRAYPYCGCKVLRIAFKVFERPKDGDHRQHAVNNIFPL